MNNLPDPVKFMELLRKIKPTASPCSPEVRDWWDNKALPILRDQALSELRRNDGFPPRLFGFMNSSNTLAIVDVAKATSGNWGDNHSKNITAFIHRIAAMVPGTYASVFASEVWALRANSKGDLDRDYEKYPNLGDHPDRTEAVMFQMLHYEPEQNAMMQLSTMIETIKVLGQRTRMSWQHTNLSDVVNTSDPLSDKTMTGRFIFGDPDNPT